MKKRIRIICIISFITAFCVLPMTLFGCSGCSRDETSSHNDSPGNNSTIKTVEPDNIESQNEMSSKEGLSGKTLILNIESMPVYWPEFHFWLNYIGKYYKNYHEIDEITDWSVEQNGVSLSEFFLSTAVGYACKDRTIEAKAEELGIELSEDDLAKIEEKREENIKIYGSESEYLRIVSRMYASEDVFKYLTKIDYLGNYLFEYLYGANGEKCSNEDVLAYVEEQSYMCTKYIFLSNTDSEGNELSMEKRAENYELLENILSQLDASDDLPALFDTLISEYGEDTTVSKYPDGRLFASGSKGEEFESAYLKLKENEYSGIVKTDDGYYVILRMPIFPEMKADSTGNTLRYWTAYELFKKKIDDWSAEMEIEYIDAYYAIDVEEVLG